MSSQAYHPATTVADVLAQVRGRLPVDVPLVRLTGAQWRGLLERLMTVWMVSHTTYSNTRTTPHGRAGLWLVAEGGEVLVDASRLRRLPLHRQPRPAKGGVSR